MVEWWNGWIVEWLDCYVADFFTGSCISIKHRCVTPLYNYSFVQQRIEEVQ
jgi:hypothetical protein